MSLRTCPKHEVPKDYYSRTQKICCCGISSLCFQTWCYLLLWNRMPSRAETNEAEHGVSCRDVSGQWVSHRWKAVGSASPLGSALTLLCVITSTITWIETGLFKWAIIGISLWYFVSFLWDSKDMNEWLGQLIGTSRIVKTSLLNQDSIKRFEIQSLMKDPVSQLTIFVFAF